MTLQFVDCGIQLGYGRDFDRTRVRISLETGANLSQLVLVIDLVGLLGTHSDADAARLCKQSCTTWSLSCRAN